MQVQNSLGIPLMPFSVTCLQLMQTKLYPGILDRLVDKFDAHMIGSSVDEAFELLIGYAIDESALCSAPATK